jgi:hypothetical protein
MALLRFAKEFRIQLLNGSVFVDVTFFDGFFGRQPSPDISVRPRGVDHQWGKDPLK